MVGHAGSAIWTSNVNVEIHDSCFYNNTALHSEAQVRISDGGQWKVIPDGTEETGVSLKGAPAKWQPGEGGVMYLEGGYFNMTNSLFIENMAENYGGVLFSKNVEISVESTYFTSNFAPKGSVFYIKGSGNVSINADTQQNLFYQNRATLHGGTVHGKGMFCEAEANQSITLTTATMYVEDQGFEECVFIHNDDGGCKMVYT